MAAEPEILGQIMKSAIGTAFGIVQALTLVVIGAAFKTYWDVLTLKGQMDTAFAKLRVLRERLNEIDPGYLAEGRESLDELNLKRRKGRLWPTKRSK